MSTLICGISYGDEGKGRIAGLLAKHAKCSIRFNGGPNAGHTVYDELGRCFKLHQLPCGAVFGNYIVLDAGMVVSIKKLQEELKVLAEAGIKPKISMSESVHIIQDTHTEADKDGSGIGSTKSGIAYVYADRALRKGVRAADKLNELADMGIEVFRGVHPFVDNYDDDLEILLEGAQGIMLDVDYGDYPYVTSSQIMPSYRYNVNSVVGVGKGYVTRVGEGPPYYPDIPELRERGTEFGTTTGRPRKCTWLDMDQMRYAISVVAPTEIVMTKMDILDGMQIYVYERGIPRLIGSLDLYKNYLIEQFPMLSAFSNSAHGPLEIVQDYSLLGELDE